MRPAKSLLGEVYCLSKPAVPVWVVLTMLARSNGRRCFRIRRSQLGRACGINRPATVSTALSALETLGVVKRKIIYRRRPDGAVYSSLSITLKRTFDRETCTPCIESQNAHDLQEDSAECANKESRTLSTLISDTSNLRMASSSAGVCASRTPAAATPAPKQHEIRSSASPNAVRANPESSAIPATRQRRN